MGGGRLQFCVFPGSQYLCPPLGFLVSLSQSPYGYILYILYVNQHAVIRITTRLFVSQQTVNANIYPKFAVTDSFTLNFKLFWQSQGFCLRSLVSSLNSIIHIKGLKKRQRKSFFNLMKKQLSRKGILNKSFLPSLPMHQQGSFAQNHGNVLMFVMSKRTIAPLIELVQFQIYRGESEKTT